MNKYPNVTLREFFRSRIISAAFLKMGPGAVYPLHKHEFHTEYYIILRGRMNLTLGDKRLSLKGPHIIKIPKNVPHSVLSSGHGNLYFITTSQPEYDEEDMVELETK